MKKVIFLSLITLLSACDNSQHTYPTNTYSSSEFYRIRNNSALINYEFSLKEKKITPEIITLSLGGNSRFPNPYVVAEINSARMIINGQEIKAQNAEPQTLIRNINSKAKHTTFNDIDISFPNPKLHWNEKIDQDNSKEIEKINTFKILIPVLIEGKNTDVIFFYTKKMLIQ